MELVDNAEYYHIHRMSVFDDVWQVNNIVHCGDGHKNPFRAFYHNYAATIRLPGDPTQYAVLKALDVILENPGKYNLNIYIDVLKKTRVALRENRIFTRETIFEEVRAKYFPDLPSRQSCIWVATREAIPFWWEELSKGPNKCKIFKLKLTGVIHRTNEKYLVDDTISHLDIIHNAIRYWKGEDGSGSLSDELLFKGRIEIIEEYNDLNDLTKKTQI